MASPIAPPPPSTFTFHNNSSSRWKSCTSTRRLLSLSLLASTVTCLFSIAEITFKHLSVHNVDVQHSQFQFNNHILSAQSYKTGIHQTQIKPYNLTSLTLAIKSFQSSAFFFVYDSKHDQFVVISNTAQCTRSCTRVYRIAATLSYTLRNYFPKRFVGQEDWGVLLSTGDTPGVFDECVRCRLNRGDECCLADLFGPILHFGSVFDAAVLPSAVAMPMVVRPHLPCFYTWQISVFQNKTSGKVCDYLLPINGKHNDLRKKAGTKQLGFMFREDLSWGSLIPQIIWRGTDFAFLPMMNENMRVPNHKTDVEPKIAAVKGESNVTRAAIKALWDLGDDILRPRWKGVLLTSKAEIEAKELTNKTNSRVLPWINVKFASVPKNFNKIPASEDPNLISLNSVGVSAIGEYISVEDQARYKYQIDLGGGGGTTWTGTIQKLAMPGVLFHHVTPTTDYFYNRLIPWVHYIPVRTDLSDLRERFEWAEMHQDEAQKIARAGTEFAKQVGTVDGFDAMNQEYLIEPLKKCLNAYVQLDKRISGNKTAMDLIEEEGIGSWLVVEYCSGRQPESCRYSNGIDVDMWKKE